VDCSLQPLIPSLPVAERQSADAEDGPNGWRFVIELSALELKYYDIAPHLLNLLEKVNDVRAHKTSLFLLLTELLVNAIDHGLLNLDSSIKTQPEGFEKYLALRAERLAALTTGKVSVAIERVVEQGLRMMKITVRDSGSGFDHEKFEAKLQDHQVPYGRGLSLVKSLSYKIEFRENGSEAVVYYPY